ncbi:MAG: hypothetical protein WAX14_07165 [Rhodococcus sp. (in: high G+C Gram-positive bacteria)]
MSDLEFILVVVIVTQNVFLLVSGFVAYRPNPCRDTFGESATEAMRRSP